MRRWGEQPHLTVFVALYPTLEASRKNLGTLYGAQKVWESNGGISEAVRRELGKLSACERKCREIVDRVTHASEASEPGLV